MAPCPACKPGGRWQAFLAAGTIALVALAAYANSFAGVNVFDDQGSITENSTIRHIWPISRVLSPPGSGETVSGRPLLNLSFALNYAVGQTRVWGYHAVNLTIHILAALLLFGIVRRTLLLLWEREKPKPSAEGQETRIRGDKASHAACLSACLLAFSIALLWVVHPLQTESVTYIVQRAESLVGFFYLLTLYCVIRGVQDDEGQPPILWHIGAVLACLLGMATKEVMVTAPLMVLLYDRTFIAGTFRGALGRRWGLYVCLAATWALLGYLVVSTGVLLGHVAHDRWSYACAQPGVLLHYLRLCLWPYPLCLDYEWEPARSVTDVLPPAIVVGGLIAVMLWGLVRNRPWGFLGAWLFLILAPTSSIIPLADVACEHRMYLPLAAVATVVVLGLYTVCEALALSAPRRATVLGCLLGGVGLVLAILTWQRNNDYRDACLIWQDVVARRPNNSRALNNLGIALAGRGQIDEAIALYQRALEINPDYARAHYNFGLALAGRGHVDEAIAHYRRAVEISPDIAEAHNNLAIALVGRRKVDEALAHYRKALEIKPDFAEVYNNLGNALAGRGQLDEAIAHYRKALEIEPQDAAAHYNLGNALAGHGRLDEALGHYEAAFGLASAGNDTALAAASRTQITHLQSVAPAASAP